MRKDSHRDTAHLHASEMCKREWCPRASWYTLRGVQRETSEKLPSSALINIYEEGNDVHARYQKALWADGSLQGVFRCLDCMHSWWDTSPLVCGACESVHLVYDEVPIADEEIMLLGHADGIVVVEGGRRVLLEIKTVGEGTYRLETPGLHARFQRGEITMQEMWKELTRPFPSHLKQGNLYCRALGIDTCVFIYESKAHQQQREFVVHYHPPIIADIVEKAKGVKHALETGTVVRRPEWADDEDHKVCKACPYRRTCWQLEEENVSGTVQATRGREDAGAAKRKVGLFGSKA